MIQAIIFDLDGVLVDSEPVKIEAWKYTLDQFGVPGGDTFYIERIGIPGLVIAADAVKKFKLNKTVAEVMDMRESYYHERRHTVPIIPSTIKFLNSLPPKLPVGVASSASREMIVGTLNRLGIGKRVNASVSGFDDGLKDKPDPAIYLHAAKLLKVDPKQCVAIEDSQTGLDAAKAAGMFCVGFSGRGQPLKADLVVSDTSTLTLADLESKHSHWIRKA